VCLIHDSAFDSQDVLDILGTKDVELQQVRRYTETDAHVPYIKHWEDELQWWADVAAADDDVTVWPDIIMIDCEFSDDTTGPRSHEASDMDIRGLIFGLAHVAFGLGAKSARPFGYAVYSAMMHRLHESPLAVTILGMLYAMRGALPPFQAVAKSRRTLQTVLREMFADTGNRAGAAKTVVRQDRDEEEITGGEPKAGLKPALARLRARLGTLVAEGRVAFDRASLTRADAELSAAIEERGRTPDERLAITWSGAGFTDRVLVTSVFADLRDAGEWTESGISAARECVREWIESDYAWHQSDYVPARIELGEINEDGGMWEGQIPEGTKLNRTRQRGVAFCMHAMYLKAVGMPVSLNSVTAVSGTQLVRAIEFGLRRELKPSEALRLLSSDDHLEWPFDLPCLLCVRQYLKDKGIPEKTWPAMLR
jgi:hypothetical protein